MTSTPDFLIVGAAKSGTSSLHNYLQRHPDIYMPEKRKELYFWHAATNENRSIIEYAGEDGVPLSINDYLSFYSMSEPGQITGEACPSYLFFHHHVLENLKRYHDKWKDVKIVIILREPVSRIVSQYKFVCKKRLDPDSLSFSDSIKAEEKRLKENNVLPDLFYVSVSMYYEKVKFYLDNFNNVHVCLYEDLKNQPRLLLEELCEFLEVDPEKLPEFEFEVANSSSGAKRSKYPKIEKWVRKLGRSLLPWLPVKLKRQLKDVVQSLTSEHIEISTEIVDSLYVMFEEERVKMEQLLQRELPAWKAPK